MIERSRIHQLTLRLLNCLRDLDWIPILLVRLSVGVLFFESGRGKLFYKLEELGDYFVQLGIPFPHFNATFVASIEFIGGICLVLGVLTRVFAVPLAFTMFVAILTAAIKKVDTLGDFLYLPEVLLLVIFVWLIFTGSGKISLDHLIGRKLGLRPGTTEETH